MKNQKICHSCLPQRPEKLANSISQELNENQAQINQSPNNILGADGNIQLGVNHKPKHEEETEKNDW